MLKNKQGFLIKILIIYTLQDVEGFSLSPGIVISFMLILIKTFFYLVVVIAQLVKTQSGVIFKEKFLSMIYLLNTLRTIESGLLAVLPHLKNRGKIHLSSFGIVWAGQNKCLIIFLCQIAVF